jgi:hypothetical protein
LILFGRFKVEGAEINDVEGVVPSVEELDLDAVFGDDTEYVDVDVVDFVCQRPHWSVSREEIRKVLQVVLSFPAKSTVFMALWKVGSKLHIHANNRDAFIDSELPILNEDAFDSGDRVYFVESDKLLAFVSAYKQFVFSFDEQGGIFYESPYTLFKLDTLALALEEVRIESEDVKEWVPFPLTKAEIGVLKTLYGFAVKLSDSRVLIDEGKAEAFFTLYKYTLNGPTKVKERVIIRRLDLPTIYEVSDGDLWFGYTAGRLYFKFSLGVVSFIRLPYEESDFLYPETFAMGGSVGQFQVDVPLIRRAFKLTNLLHIDSVEFRQDGSDVVMVASDKAKFRVGRGSVTQEFLINTEIFSRILNTVDVGEIHIDVVVTEQGMDLILNRSVQTVYSMARTSVLQYKKDEKAAQRLGLRDERVQKQKDAGKSPELVVPPPGKTLADVFKDGDLFK